MEQPVKAWISQSSQEMRKIEPRQKLAISLQISKIFGLLPHNDNAELSRFWLVEAITIRIIELIIGISGVYFSLTVKYSPTDLYLMYCTFTGTLLTTISHLVSLIINHDKWQKLVKNNIQNYYPKYSNTYFYICIIRILIQILLNVMTFYLQDTDLLELADSLVLNYTSMIVSIITNHFCANIELLTKQLHLITNELINVKRFKEYKPLKLKQLAMRQHQLIDLGQIINKMFAIQNLIICTISLICLLDTTSELIDTFAIVEPLSTRLARISDNIFYLSNALFVAYFCEVFAGKVSTIIFLLHEKLK